MQPTNPNSYPTPPLSNGKPLWLIVTAALLIIVVFGAAIASVAYLMSPASDADSPVLKATPSPVTAQATATDAAPLAAFPNNQQLGGSQVDASPVVAPTPIEVHYAAPDGAAPPAGDGSLDKPWDLQSALSKDNVQPGEWVYLLGGTYTPPDGKFTSNLEGSADAPIIVKPYNGERVSIDRAHVEPEEAATLVVTGRHTWYWGFEVMNSDPTRTTQLRGSNPAGLSRADGLRVTGPDNKFINLLVHDNADGIGFWGPATGSEIYGSIIYNNGWDGPTPPSPTPDDRAHGHGVYTQNNDPAQPKVIRDNIIFNNFEYGVKVYTQGGAKLQGYVIEGNMLATNGSYAHPKPDGRNIYVGSTRPDNPAANISLNDNYAYQISNRAGVDNIELGHVGSNRDITIQNNVFEGGKTVLWFGQWEQVTATQNILLGGSNLVNGPDPAVTLPSAEGTDRLVTLRAWASATPVAGAWSWDNNAYFGNPSLAMPFKAGRDGMTWQEWQRDIGYDANGAFTTFSGGAPSNNLIAVRPNRYESGRANIAVFNPSGAPSVSVDVSGVVKLGDSYEVRNAQDYYAAPVTRGDSFDGNSIVLPMSALPPAAPIGWTGSQPPVSGPYFGAFVLVSGESGGVEAPP